MLTSRGGWFLVIAIAMLLVGAFLIPDTSVIPALIGLTALLWFAMECVFFRVRSLSAVSRLRVTRRVLQGNREVPVVWAGVNVEVRVTIENPSSIAIPFAVFEDRRAVATEHIAGSLRLQAIVPARGTVQIVYTVKFPAPGLLRFEGLSVRVADLQGFFQRALFIRDAAEFLVLPPLTDDEGRQRATKRFNTLPAPGIHRLRRPGSGSELLDLRDYRPGDPPKMIAWKASARRDRLITKEFENDVPVRCVLFLDTSEGVRLGPPGNSLLTRLAGVAAVVAQAASANRDIVGLTTIDEAEARVIPPARTRVHTIQLLRRLAEVSALQPGVTGVTAEYLTSRAYPLAQELYPELMTRQVNSMPMTRLWLPLLDRKYGWIAPALVLIGVLLLALGSFGTSLKLVSPRTLADEGPFGTRVWHFVLRNAQSEFWHKVDRAAWLANKASSFGKMRQIYKLLFMVVVFLPAFFPPATLALIFWFFYSIRGLFGQRKRDLLRRKRLSALLSVQDGAGVNGVERYVHDDEAYARRVAVFLQLHLLRCPVPLYDDSGRYRFRCAGKAQVLADAMVRAVGRARDNELYVVLADLAELGADLTPIVKACRVARSRHHHVLVIVPWPADVPSPDDPGGFAAEEEDDPADRIALPRRTPRPLQEEIAGQRSDRLLTKLVRHNLTRQYHETFRFMRRQLSRMGATVMRVNDGDPVQLVLDRLDRLRGMRSRR